MLGDDQRDRTLTDALDTGSPLAVVPIEDMQSVISTQAQYPPEVASDVVAEAQLRAGGQSFRDIKAFQRHRSFTLFGTGH